MPYIRTAMMRIQSRLECSAVEAFLEERETSLQYPDNTPNVVVLAAVEDHGPRETPVYSDEKILGTLVCAVEGGKVEVSQVVVGDECPEMAVAALGVKVVALEAAVSVGPQSFEREDELMTQIADMAGFPELEAV